MSVKLLKTVAVLLLALALAALAWAFRASNQRVAIQGPSALAVLADQSVWLSVDDELWHLDPSGRRIARVPAKALAVGGLIGNLVVHPNGQLVASVRDDPSLYFLDPATAKISARLLPQWPTDLERHGSRAISYAFHVDGRLAISTGGGHAVAVFGADGRFLGRSAPGLYAFTNGLWWTETSLWTTDTNRMSLLELDAQTLALKSRIALTHNRGQLMYLGMATPSQGQPTAGGPAPLATLVRFANGMVLGHATDVLGDGTQIDFPEISALEPRDIKWRGNELLLVDGLSYAIKRYAADHRPMADFGDAQLRADLAGLLDRRASLQGHYSAGLTGAVLLFVLGFAAALRAQVQEKTKTLQTLKLDLSQLGTARLSQEAMVGASLRLVRLPLGLTGVSTLLGLLPWTLFGLSASAARWVAMAGVLLTIAAAIFFLITLRRAMADPGSEAVFNYRAVRALENSPAFWQLRQPGELPRETLMLTTVMGSLQWLVLTNHRLLVFSVSHKDSSLVAEYPRRAIASLVFPGADELTGWQRLQRRVSLGTALRFEFKDGSSLAGTTPAAATARRMADLLRASAFDAPSVSEMGQALRAQARQRPAVGPDRAAAWQALASFLVPGLGQHMQGRSGTALHLFIGWLLTLIVLVVMVWVWWAPRADVPLKYALAVVASYLLVCSAAALDAWRMGRQNG